MHTHTYIPNIYRHIPLDSPPLWVHARGWYWTIEDHNKTEGGKPSPQAYVLFNIRVETTAGTVTYSTKMVYTVGAHVYSRVSE